MAEDQIASRDVPLARRVVLPYQGPLPTSAVTVRTFYNAIEAQIFANELAAHGVEYFLANENANTFLGWYSGFTQVELQVRKEDAAAADELLGRLQLKDPTDVEPLDESDPNEPIADPAGGQMLVTVAAYDDPRKLYDAAAALGAARVESYMPTLLPRGNRPRGTGRRFALRVRESDRQRAAEVLEQAKEQETADNEPRCPRCGSWQVHVAPAPWPGLIKFLLGGASARPRQLECLRCHHRWTGDVHE